MKYTKNLLAALALLFVPLSMTVAQDDVYFVGKKTKKAATEVKAATQQPTTHYTPVEIIYADDDEAVNVSGSKRDVDEYNRRGSYGRQSMMVENPDGTFSYQVPGNDTLYIMPDSTAVTSRSLANDAYSQGYNEGYQDGEDYALTRRINRFGYGYNYYDDPFYWDSYWYDPYWSYGYYGWTRPYWGYRGYWGYDPYWYGGYYPYYSYYGWGYYPSYWGYGGYYRGYYGRPHNSHTDGAHTSRYRGDTGRSAGYNRGRGTVNSSGTVINSGRTRSFGTQQSTTSRSANTGTYNRGTVTNSTNRVSSFGTNRSTTTSTSSASRSSSFGTSSSSSSSRSGGFSSGSSSSSRSGGFSGGGGGGGFTGGSRGGGGGGRGR